VSGASEAFKLLGQPATADRLAGASVAVLIVAVALALVGGRRREPAVEESARWEPEMRQETEP
jgi:hypothetical protein